MKELNELASIITESSQRTFPLLDLRERKKSRESTLFLVLQQGKCENDEQASQWVYGKPVDSRFRMLKSRLRKKMYNHLFFLDFTKPRFLPYLRYEQECYDLLHQARMVISTSNYELAHDMMIRCIRIAEEMGFTQICVDCLELWRYIYVRHTRTDAFRKNQVRLDHFRALARHEQEAEDIYFLSRLEMNRSVEARKKYLPQLLQVLPRLKELWEIHHSPNVFNFYHKLTLWYHELVGDFHEIIRITSESEQLAKDKVIHPLRFESFINKHMQVYAYLRVKDYEKGLLLAQEYLPAFHPDTNNWFGYMENYVLLAVHAQRYELAVELVGQVDANPAFEKITRRSKEKWTLYRAYLYFIQPSEALLRRFDYQRFVQSVPEYSKDKKGFNVAILILQFLHYLKTDQADALLYRIECLRKYALLHLKEQGGARSKAFFKLLELVVRENYHPVNCRLKSRYLYTRLQSSLPAGDTFAEIEIIPYEHLWDWLLDTLKAKRRGRLKD